MLYFQAFLDLLEKKITPEKINEKINDIFNKPFIELPPQQV